MGNRRWTSSSLGEIFRLYVFSPCNLLPRILKKIALDQAGALLIALWCGLRDFGFLVPYLSWLIIPRYFLYLLTPVFSGDVI